MPLPLGQFMEAAELPRLGVTAVYEVTNKRHGDVLGHIRWNGGWRQYVFETERILLSHGCMRDLERFLVSLNADQKRSAAQRRGNREEAPVDQPPG